jgi:hypothetical protein
MFHCCPSPAQTTCLSYNVPHENVCWHAIKKIPIDLFFQFVKENVGMEKKKQSNQYVHNSRTEKS